MRKIRFILFLVIFPAAMAGAQEQFYTIVPLQPVVSGESFQVQYIIRGAEKIGNFNTPVFPQFRFVSGPAQYQGTATGPNGIIPIRNYVFTLAADRPGRFMIPGATATVNGRPVKSNAVMVEIISKEEAMKSADRNTGIANPDYVLRPGEDPYEKIRQNLFLKLVVDRTRCMAGEPLLAIFKLYSRLESNSDIVKNPGFYGFTVHDMVNLADRQVSTEIINGRLFDVHTIRKVQLFPLQAGLFTIDPMEVKNKVEFSRSRINKKTEQEIAEGIMGNGFEESPRDGAEVFETSMHTEPVIIRVRPVPVTNKPAAYNGAVGLFSITGSAVRDQLAKNETGVLEITISGEGNFTQLTAPVIDWPAGIEGFDPVIMDSLDKTRMPLTGSRTFRYSFTGSKPGVYTIPLIRFSFFDPRKNRYNTDSTRPVRIEIGNQVIQAPVITEKRESIAAKNSRASRVAAGIIIALVIIVLVYWILQKDTPDLPKEQEPVALPVPEEGLEPATDLVDLPGKEFYRVLQQHIWKNLGDRLGLSGSAVNKEMLYEKLKQSGVGENILINLKKILMECEVGMFTGASPDSGKDHMLAEAKAVMKEISRVLL